MKKNGAKTKKKLNEHELLDLAKSCLEIDGVILRGSKFEMDSELEPGVNAEDREYGFQQGNQPKAHYIAEVDKKEVFIVHHGFGMRLIDPIKEGEEVPEKPRVWVSLQALYAVRYVLRDGCKMPSKDALKLFAEVNAPYNLWAFWREHAHSITQKAGMVGFTLPLYFCETRDNEPVSK